MNILEEYREPSFAEKFGRAFQNFGQSAAQNVPAFFVSRENTKNENEAAKKLGIDLQGVTDPETRKHLFIEALKQQGNREELGIKQKSQADQFQRMMGMLGLGQGSQNPLMNQTPSTNPNPQGSDEYQLDNNEQSSASRLSDDQILALSFMDPQIAKLAQAQKEANERPKSEKQREYFKLNEPKLAEIADTERRLALENSRLGRLSNLFSDPSKFPSPFTAALFTREGQINDIAYSQLTPEAQEALKLITDFTSGIKDSFGARVTNFDLQTYLKKLPGLLNSPEGKTRVVRDLKEINDINQLYNSGIQKIFEDAGGSDKLPFSKAETIFKKKYGKQLDKMLENFVSKGERNVKSLPEPTKFLGKKFRNDRTGELFISDGTSWKPYIVEEQ